MSISFDKNRNNYKCKIQFMAFSLRRMRKTIPFEYVTHIMMLRNEIKIKNKFIDIWVEGGMKISVKNINIF